jgi:hypothetical protein
MKHQTTKNGWLAVAMVAQLCAGTSVFAGAVPGDFEAKVALRNNDTLISLPISVSLNVTSRTSDSPKFSGYVVVGGVRKSLAGTFSATVDEEGVPGPFEAIVKEVKGVSLPPFLLRYALEGAGSDAGESSVTDSLTLSFGEFGEFEARHAAQIDDGQTGAPIRVDDAFAGAFKANANLEGLPERISALSTAIENLELGLPEAEGSLIEAKDAYDIAKEELESLKGSFKSILGKSKSLVEARAKRDAAVDSVDETLSDALESLTEKLLTLSIASDPSEARDEAELLYYEILESFLIPAAESGDLEQIDVLEAFPDILRNVLNSDDDNFQSALEGLPFAVAWLSDDVQQMRAVLVEVLRFAPDLSKGAVAVGEAEIRILNEQENLGDDFQVLEDAENQIAAQEEVVRTALAERTDVEVRVQGYRAAILSAKELEKTLDESSKLLGFTGYGTYQASVKSSNGTQSGPLTAMFVGVAPDGQKFSYSSKMLTSGLDERGVFVVNTLAGSRLLFTEVQYELDASSQEIIGRPSLTEEADQPASWAGLEVEQFLGRALLPFTDEEGNPTNLLGGATKSSAVVAFGEPEENGAITGFGAEVTADNKVAKLLLPRKGSAFKVTAAKTSVSTFQGSFPMKGSVVSPFAGIFMQLDEGGVRGFGSLVSSKAASVPVEVYVADSEDAGDPPVLPEIPVEPLVVWSGLSGGTISLQLTDMPSQLNLTTVKLFRGSSQIPVATVEASADGRVVFPTKGLVAAKDYYVQVERQFITGAPQSVDGSEVPFEISARVLPAYTYQMLIGPGEGGVARNGMSHQGRLTVTTTSSGGVSGRLEWIRLTQVRDGSGQISDYTYSGEEGESAVYIPSLVNSPFKGQLTVATPNDEGGDEAITGLNELTAVLTVPTAKGQPGHQLRVSISDAPSESEGNQWFTNGGGSPSAIALRASAVLEMDPSFGEGALQYGSGYAATGGVSGASGEYKTVSAGEDGEAVNNQSHTIRYSGGPTALYTFQTGAKSAKLTSAANVSVTGDVPLLLCGVLAKYKMPYENAGGRTVTANMATLVAGTMSPTISLNGDDENGDDEKYWISEAQMNAAGCDLEVAAKTPGGYVLREEWASLFEQIGFSAVFQTLSTKRFADFSSKQKILAGENYTFELVLNDETVLSDTVTFTSSGKATFSEVDNGKAITLSATAKGTFDVQVKLLEGAVSATGKAVKSSGFALPGNPLFGWGGIEGGDVGWRLRQ